MRASGICTSLSIRSKAAKFLTFCLKLLRRIHFLRLLRRYFFVFFRSIFYRIRSSTNVSCLLALYHARATNYINYCITTWHAGSAVLLNQIQKQSYKIIRSIFHRDKFSKVHDVYRNYGILQVYDLFKFHVACFVYNHVNNQLPPCFENIFLKTCDNRSCQTRQSNNLYLPLYKRSVCQQTISFFGVKIWNDLPQTIRSIKSFKKFKITLKKFLLRTNLNHYIVI